MFYIFRFFNHFHTDAKVGIGLLFFTRDLLNEWMKYVGDQAANVEFQGLI